MFVALPFRDTTSRPLPPLSTLTQLLSYYRTLHEFMMAELHLSLPDDMSSSRLRYESTRNARTRGQFKPRNANKGTSSYQLRQFAEATLGSGSLRKAVKLPDGEDLSEWLAVNGRWILFVRRCSNPFRYSMPLKVIS